MKTRSKEKNDKATSFASDGLDLLLKKRSGPCLSILIQFHPEPSMKRHNYELLKSSLAKANLALEAYPGSDKEKQKILLELEEFSLAFDAAKCKQAVGLFIAKDITRLVFFPFEVNETVIVADSFEIRDVLYLRQYLSPYYILLISGKSIHLFRAQAEVLDEIRDNSFPMKYVDDREYARSSRGTSFGFATKGFEKDKNALTKERTSAFLKQAGNHFSKYLDGPTHTVILAGTGSLIKQFRNQLALKHEIAGTVAGNFSAKKTINLAREAWAACRRMREVEIGKMIKKLDDQALRYKAKGLRKVWEAASAGKGLLLLVDKDFRQPAYIPQGTAQIRLHPPKGNFRYVADAVDDVIEKVLDAHGQVFITAPSQLAKFENIGMMLRY